MKILISPKTKQYAKICQELTLLMYWIAEKIVKPAAARTYPWRIFMSPPLPISPWHGQPIGSEYVAGDSPNHGGHFLEFIQSAE